MQSANNDRLLNINITSLAYLNKDVFQYKCVCSFRW